MSVNIAAMRAVAIGARTYLADPERVVLNPDNLYEASDGNPFLGSWSEKVPPRMCFVGALVQSAGPENTRLWSATCRALEQQAGVVSLTDVLRNGPEACVALIDGYLAATDD